MSPRTSRRFFGSDDVPRLPLRKRSGNCLTPPASAVSCAGTLSSIQVALPGSALVKDDRGAGTEPVRKKTKYARLVVGVDEEQQVTPDLCASFLNVESTEFGSVEPWRSTSNSPNSMDPQQSGTTSEEDLKTRDAIDDDSTDTVRSAAELLTQLICERNAGSSNGQLQGPGVPHSQNPQREALDQPIRWGVKKKVSYESRRSVDSCDPGICTSLIRKLSHDQKKPTARTPDPNTFHSPVASWDPSSPNINFPASPDLHQDRRSSGDGVASSILHSPGLSFQGPRSERQKKLLPMTLPCPGNILKLPKEMQGRWSCERYKIAQLKLIEIMQERKTAPGRPILRPALREEARKHIGDTGLLDHLLKHMTDTVVSTGERFRRRHNSEGAMEYWLEHASLMELRKAAGVEDPSWIPPAGWKVGDQLPDRNWQLTRGMTSAEAAEMKKLKETVERLRSEMKVLCGSITVSSQRGALPIQSTSYDDLLGVPERAEEEGNLIQGSIQKETIHFKSDMISMEQPSHEELISGAYKGITMERSQSLESTVPKIHEDRKLLKENGSPSGNQLDLECQLQDVRKTVAMVQVDVSHVIIKLGIVPPVKAKPTKYLLDSRNVLPIMLSAGDETYSVTQRRSPESQSSDISLLRNFVIPTQDASMKQCSTASRSSNGGYMVGHSAPYTEGLSQALSSYNLVNQPEHLNENKKYSESTMKTHDGGPPLTVLSRAQNFLSETMLTSRPTGFTICRPPGSFLWPSMQNVTQVLPTNNPSSSTRVQTVDLRVLEGGSGDLSSGIPMSLPMASVSHSNRSIAELKDAATMSTIFGCMASIPQFSLPNATSDDQRSRQGQK